MDSLCTGRWTTALSPLERGMTIELGTFSDFYTASSQLCGFVSTVALAKGNFKTSVRGVDVLKSPGMAKRGRLPLVGEQLLGGHANRETGERDIPARVL